jgi:hypothetical protein
MPQVDIILREASTILSAAQRHATELSDLGVTENEIHRLRTLILHAAMHGYTRLKDNENAAAVMLDLQETKDLILSIAELKFGTNATILNEFRLAS